ncbi:MAG: hypothetical protein HFE63_07040 [Clostridiales bacterium]|nr:hypothetical protein [Clostridiales bacterium]
MNNTTSIGVKLTDMQLNDHIGALGRNITENWLLGLKQTNPALLYMFRDKNVAPYRRLLPWAGEFPGKYLTGCAAMYRLFGDERLKDECLEVIKELISYQEPNGYLGVFPEEYQLTGRSPEPELLDDKSIGVSLETWDAWGHYHIMYGLLEWYDITGDKAMLDCIDRIAELFINTFYKDTGRRLIDIGWAETNLATYHVFTKLYNYTGDEKYLDLAKEIEKDCSEESAGNYLEYARQNLPFYQCPKPRWESLHVIMGFAEMAKAVDQPEYLEAAKQIFYSILSTDVHNTGGFSTREQAIGNPYGFGAIETCCVVAYNALALQLYQATGDPKLVDFLEHSLYNAVAGSFSKSGRWSTYNTPMEGFRMANYHEIGFQSRPGAPDLNCCSVNAHRGVGMLADWAYVQRDTLEKCDTLMINYYGNASFTTADGDEITIEGSYPFSESVKVTAKLTNGKKLCLRIPGFAPDTTISNTANFTKKANCFESDGSSELSAELHIPLHIRIDEGKEGCDGRYCIFRGPILLGYDRDENPSVAINEIPRLSSDVLESATVNILNDGELEMLVDVEGKTIKLNDFYTLGQRGSWYTTWLYK